MTWTKIRNPIYDPTITSKSCFRPALQLAPYSIPMLNYRKQNLWRAFVDFRLDNDEKVASRLRNIPISRLEYKNHTLFMTKWPKPAKIDTLFMTKQLKDHTLWGRTYLYSPYKGVPPPPRIWIMIMIIIIIIKIIVIIIIIIIIIIIFIYKALFLLRNQ